MDTNDLKTEFIKRLNAEVEAQIASAFFLKYNANILILLEACPIDFRREIQGDYERYYWCHDLFLTVHKVWSEDGTKLTYKYIY